MRHAMDHQWGMLWSNNGAYHEAAMGHTMEHTMSRKRAYMEQQWGIPWSSNGAYHGAMIGHIQPHYVSIYSPVIILLHPRI